MINPNIMSTAEAYTVQCSSSLDPTTFTPRQRQRRYTVHDFRAAHHGKYTSIIELSWTGPFVYGGIQSLVRL